MNVKKTRFLSGDDDFTLNDAWLQGLFIWNDTFSLFPENCGHNGRWLCCSISVCLWVCGEEIQVFHEKRGCACLLKTVCCRACRAFVFVFPTPQLKLSTLFLKLTGACAGPRTARMQTHFTYANVWWLPPQMSSGVYCNHRGQHKQGCWQGPRVDSYLDVEKLRSREKQM